MDPIKGNDFVGNQNSYREGHRLLKFLYSYRPSRTFSLIALLLISVMLPVSVYVAQQQQTYQQSAAVGQYYLCSPSLGSQNCKVTNAADYNSVEECQRATGGYCYTEQATCNQSCPYLPESKRYYPCKSSLGSQNCKVTTSNYYTSVEECQTDQEGYCYEDQETCTQWCLYQTTPTPTLTSTACASNYNACDIPRRDCCSSGFVCGSEGTCVPGSSTSPTRTPTPTRGGTGGGNPTATPTPGGSGVNQCDTPGAAVASCSTSCPLANDPRTCPGHTYCVYSPGGNTISPCDCDSALLEQACGIQGTSPTPTPGGNPSCELMSSCNGATCTFTNNFFMDGVKQTNYLSTLQPNIEDNGTVTGWCTNRTFTHTYSSVSEGPYTAELNVGFGSISTDSNNDGCQDSGNPPNLQWQYSCRTKVFAPEPRCKSGLIEGNVYVDTNRNGHKDSGEINYRGATLKLSGVQEEVEISNGDGNYQFDDLPEGQYSVTVDVDNYDPTTTDPASPNIDSCADQDTVNFGIVRHQQEPTRTPTPRQNTPTPTQAVGTPTPTPTLPPGGTRLSFTLYLQGVGLASNGDNTDPRHPERTIFVQIFNQTNTQVGGDTSGTVRFDSSRGLFTGTTDISNLVNGAYTVKIKSNQYLRKLIAGIQNIVSGTTNNMPQTSLVVGDINNDNKLSIEDYNIFLGCYNKTPITSTCESSNLNDDRVVDGTDYNFFIRSLSVEEGD